MFLENDHDFSDAAIAAAIAQAENEISLDHTPSRREVEDINDGKFDPTNYWIMTLAGKNNKIDKFKLEAMQQKAKSRLFSKIATLRNKGYDDDEIAYSLTDSIEALAFGGKRPGAYVKKMAAKQAAMDYFNHSERIFWDYVNHVAVLSELKALRQATKTAMPLFLLVPTLTSAVNSNRTAIVSTRYLARVLNTITRNIGTSVNSDAVETHQKRKWDNYAKHTYTTTVVDKEVKHNHINFIKGQAGGNSNNVEILKFQGTTTQTQRENAVALILADIAEGSFKDKLSVVLNAVAKMDKFTIEDHCELSNQISDLIAEFKTIADEIIFNRKAERLVESDEYADAKAEEAAIAKAEAFEASAKVDEYFKSGRNLFNTERSNVAVMEKTAQEVAVKPAQIDSKPQTNIKVTELSVTINTPQKSLQPFTAEWYAQRDKDNYNKFLNDPKLVNMEF